MKRIALTICLLLACVACYGKVLLVLKSTGSVTVSSATINSDGDTLTVVLSGSATISDATGWSIEFDNYAERTLTYSSGSGSDTLLFDIAANSTYTDENTDNDTAPVGTVALVNYDNGTGNVSNLGYVNEQSVTNNSTAIPDPDLPEQVDTSLPANWNAAADYSPADAAALQELLDGDESGDAANGTSSDWTIIELASDGTNYGPLVIATGYEYILIRSDDYASLPAYGTRLLSTDDSNGYLAEISRAPSTNAHITMDIAEGSGGPGSSHLRFIGIKFDMTGTYTSADISRMVSVGQNNGTTDLTINPTHVGFDRCLFTVSGDPEVRDVLRMDACDSFVIDSRFEGLHKGGNDGTTGIRTYVGARLKYHNNYMQTESSATFFGDNGIGRADDVTVSNNESDRPGSWDDGNGIQKSALIETKVGKRVLVENNSVKNATWQQSGFAAIQFKADGTVGTKITSHVTVRWNKVYNCNQQGIQFHWSGSLGIEGPNHDMLAKQNLVYDVSSALVINGNSSTPIERVIARHNTLLDGTICIVKGGLYHEYTDNVGEEIWANGEANGADSLNEMWGSSYDVQNNAFIGESIAFYDSDTSPTPLGTLTGNFFPADRSSMGFADEPNDDYEITSGDYNAGGSNDATDGTDLGCDVSTLETIMSGVEE